MPLARGVGKWKDGWEGRRKGGRVLAVENFNLFNYTCYDLHAVIIYYVYYIYYVSRSQVLIIGADAAAMHLSTSSSSVVCIDDWAPTRHLASRTHSHTRTTRVEREPIEPREKESERTRERNRERGRGPSRERARKDRATRVASRETTQENVRDAHAGASSQ